MYLRSSSPGTNGYSEKETSVRKELTGGVRGGTPEENQIRKEKYNLGISIHLLKRGKEPRGSTSEKLTGKVARGFH